MLILMAGFVFGWIFSWQASRWSICRHLRRRGYFLLRTDGRKVRLRESIE